MKQKETLLECLMYFFARWNFEKN